MNINIKEQFMMEAWDFNQNLTNPLDISFFKPTESYCANNLLKFLQKDNKIKMSFNDYKKIVITEIDNERKNKNAKKLMFSGEVFINQYYEYFFKKHPEYQIDLLKFYNTINNTYGIKNIDFLNDLEKNEVKQFLFEITKWCQYGDESLLKVHKLMINKNINEDDQVFILKKFIEGNSKIINKAPSLSSSLENFLNSNFFKFKNEIACNIVAIKKRQENVDVKEYENVFNDKFKFCISTKVNLSKLLKSFQIKTWNEASYQQVINIYNEHLKTNKGFYFYQNISTNNKEIELFIKMEQQDFTIEKYKEELFEILSFYRENTSLLSSKDIEKILLKKELNTNLENNNTNKNKFKI